MSRTSHESAKTQAFHGTFIHSISQTEIDIIPDALLLISEDGIITHFERDVSPTCLSEAITKLGHNISNIKVNTLRGGSFFMPGLIDTHNHAPQWSQRGQGLGKEILSWLNDTTFPHEARYKDPDYARRMYAKCVQGTLRQGTTTACYYGSLHGEATKILAETCLEKGQRALVGKCNMDRESPDYYIESNAETSLHDTEDFIAHVGAIDPASRLVTPVITPRFAISCTPELLGGLGDLAQKYPALPIQTHFEETQQEVAYTKHLYPQFANEGELWEHFNLLTPRTILGHCIYCPLPSIERMATIGCGVAHCPVSTVSVGDFGVAPIRDYLRRGMNVGLGTDVGGGYSSSILDAIRYAGVVSTARMRDTDGKDPPVTLKERFWMATMGGARVCGLGHKIGSFEVGKEFDAIEVTMTTKDGEEGSAAPVEEDMDDMEIIWEKFLMTGDDRNIARVWVKGRSVAGKVDP